MLPILVMPRRFLHRIITAAATSSSSTPPPFFSRTLSSSSSSPKSPCAETGAQDMSGFEYKQHGADDPPRLTCKSCEYIHYENPRLVIGSVPTYPCPTTGEPLFLLCRRAIPPRRGFLNLPAGYMEKSETLQGAAMREAKEEATASIKVGPILSIYDIPHIAQVHIYHLATLTSPDVAPGYESLDTQLLKWSEIDFDNLAFPTVSWALMAWKQRHDLMKEQQQVGINKSNAPLPAAAAAAAAAMAPFRNPVLPGHEGSTNVWYKPHKGGLVYDESWLRRTTAMKGV